MKVKTKAPGKESETRFPPPLRYGEFRYITPPTELWVVTSVTGDLNKIMEDRLCTSKVEANLFVANLQRELPNAELTVHRVHVFIVENHLESGSITTTRKEKK
jgi:hypothetical protein